MYKVINVTDNNKTIKFHFKKEEDNWVCNITDELMGILEGLHPSMVDTTTAVTK